MRNSIATYLPKLSTAITITYLSLSLTSCATSADTAPSNGGAPTTGSADTAPIDVRTPATFNPKDPNFKLFDPCIELDDEVFTKAGLGKRSRIGNESGEKFKICGFGTPPENKYFGSISVAMNYVDIEAVKKNAEAVYPNVDSQIPNLYQYRIKESWVHDCASVAQTSGGQLDVSVKDFDRVLSPEEVCDQSLAFLEILYPEVEKKIRDGIRGN